MKQNTILAAVLIVLGIAAFTYQGISYKTREKAIDLGSLQVTTEKTKNIPIPPIVGTLALIGGFVLLVGGARKA
jgi:cytochrome c oxidase assembly factor CtaG